MTLAPECLTDWNEMKWLLAHTRLEIQFVILAVEPRVDPVAVVVVPAHKAVDFAPPGVKLCNKCFSFLAGTQEFSVTRFGKFLPLWQLLVGLFSL